MALPVFVENNTEKDVSCYWSSLATDLHQGIINLWQEDFGTDFEIIAGEKSFRCHKVVIAAVSDYFKALFNSGMKETEQDKVVFDDISPASFETIFKILYPTEPIEKRKHPLRDTSETDVLELVKLGARFQMHFLTCLCLDFLESTLSSDNCISRWKIGEAIQCKELSDMGRDYVCENFETMVPLRALDSLEHDDFLNIIADKDMHVKDEAIIWRAIRNWIDFNEKERSQYIAEMIKECCLTEIETSFLIDVITFDPLVRLNDEASKVVQEVLRYNRHPGIHSSLELKFRECHEKRQVTVLLYDNISDKVRKDSFELGRPVKKQLKGKSISSDKCTIWPLNKSKKMVHSGKDFWNMSCCVYGQSIYVLNGTTHNESEFMQYDGCTNTWQTKRSIGIALVGHTMCALDGCLYVIGGRCGFRMNALVWKYFFDSDSWSEDGEIIAPVLNASSVAFEKKIYIIGGTIERREPADCVQVYDTETDTGTIFCNLPKPCSFSRALLRKSTIYIVTSDGDVERIAIDTAETSIIASIPLKDRQTFGINMRSDKITVYAGSRKISRVARDEQMVRPSSPELLFPQENVLDDDSDVVEDFVININSGDVEASKSLLQGCDVLGCVSLVVDSINA